MWEGGLVLVCMMDQRREERDLLGGTHGQVEARTKVRTWKQRTEIATGSIYKDDLSTRGQGEGRWKG